MGNSRKKYGKKFFNGDFHAIHYPMGNSPLHLFLWEIPLFTTPPLWEIPTQYFPYGKSPLFFINPLWEIPTTFFPMGNPHFFYQLLMGNPHYFFSYLKSPIFLSTPYGKSPLLFFPMCISLLFFLPLLFC